MGDNLGNADKPKVNKSKKAFAAVIWLAAVCAVCYILARENIFSFPNIILGSNLKKLRYQETEITDQEGSGYDAYSTINDVEEYIDTKFTLPGWLPDDYALDEVKYSDISESAVFNFSSEKNEDAKIKMIIARIIESDEHTNWNLYVEKDDTPTYALTHNNIEFEVMSNLENTTIYWDFNGYAYILSGIIEEKDVKKIVNNIR